MRYRLRGERTSRRAGAALVAPLAALICALAVAGPASAALRSDLQRFANCPLHAEIVKCVYSETTEGEFVLGKGAVPVSKPVIIQGGIAEGGVLVPAANGETLSKTALPVPGGLVGIELPGNFTEVTATAELAGQANIQTSVHLPLKVKLDNLTLGSSCYIGSEAEPLTLNLIYGTTSPPPPNKPISGHVSISTKDHGNVTVLAGELVDNSFAAPGANGCTLLPPVGDLAVNTKEGLPSPAGTNSAMMGGTTEEVAPGLVEKTLPLPDVGRCTKVEGQPEGKRLVYHGKFENSACTIESPEGKGRYEWTEGPGAGSKFTSAGGTLKLTTASGAGLFCAASSGSGQWTGAKTASATLTLTGCHIGPNTKPTACKSSGAGEGEVVTSALNGRLDFIKEGEEPEIPQVGIDLAPASGSTVAAYECAGKAATITGSVIAPVTAVDHMGTTLHIKAAGGAGKQTPEAFEEGAKDVLTYNQAGGGSEQAGLATALATTSEEALEINAAP